MYSECRHILPRGSKCKSPALAGKPYCYFHWNLTRHREDGTRADKEPLLLPSLEDALGIQMALTQVLSALGSGRITSKQAGQYLYGLQLAMQLIKQASAPAPIETVRELDCDDAGTWIGPAQTHCDPYVDCATCPTRDTCLDAVRLNMRSMHQILRSMRNGQKAWDKKLDQAENPAPPEEPGASAKELEQDFDWLLQREREENPPPDFRELIDPGHLYNFKRATTDRAHAGFRR